MKTTDIHGIFIAVLWSLLVLTACSDEETPSQPQLVQHASVQEEGQTLSPGQTAHLLGEGYLESDEVMLNFYWKTHEALFPEGYHKGYYAEITGCTSEGITIRLPYRKPESRVEIVLKRGGDMMLIGEIQLKDGTTPKDIRLYGINNNLHNKGTWTDALQITRCPYDEHADYDRLAWPLDAHPDFHSAVSCRNVYGLCGLAKAEDGPQVPFFFDFCTQRWEQLSPLPTLALFGMPSAIGALQTTDGERYALTSYTLETSDYVTAKALADSPMPQQAFPLPEGLKAGQFGEYPGAYTGKDCFLFSANQGNGKWTPVLFSTQSGFHTLDAIEADGLIPFSFTVPTENGRQTWQAGFLAARKDAANGSELYLLAEDAPGLAHEPLAVFPNRALSVSANYDRPGTLTVHFHATRSGYVTFEYHWDSNEWNSMPGVAGNSFDEIVWTN